MSHPPQLHVTPDLITSHFWSGTAIRSRSVSEVILTGTVDIPVPPTRLIADWERETTMRLGLEPGDVEALSLARSRARWPHYKKYVLAVSDWARTLGLHEVLDTSDVALMACRAAPYHHDGAHYGGMAFCNLFLSEDRGLDLHFPHAGHRIPLTRGTTVIFDTGQPHAVIRRHSSGYNVADFPSGQDFTQIFLTWELPVEDASVGHALRVAFDVESVTSPAVDEEQLWLNGERVTVCPDSGRWCHIN